MITTKRVAPFLGLMSLLTLGASGCSSEPNGPREPKLLDSPTQLDAEHERVRKMQMVTVVGDDQIPTTWTAEQFSSAVVDTCDQIPHPECQPAQVMSKGLDAECIIRKCDTDRFLCMGEVLLAAASSPSSLTVSKMVDSTHAATYKVLPQTAATNDALAEQAFQIYGLAVKSAVDTLNQTPYGGTFFPGPCPIDVTNTFSTSAVDAAGTGLVEGYHQGRKAIEIAVENVLAVSDAESASSPSLALALSRSVSRSALSRAAAAHLLVGGVPGLMGSETGAFCTTPRLSGPAQRALDILRQAAPAPVDLLNSAISIHSFLEGGGSAAPTIGSIRDRLADSFGTPIPSGQSIADVYGLREDDFAQARASMVEEFNAFARSQVATLPARVDGSGSIFPRYAATGASTRERDPAYWVSLAFTENRDSTVTTGGTWRDAIATNDPPLLSGPIDNLSSFTDYAYSWANYLLTSPALTPFQSSVINPLSLLASGRDRTARLTHCTRVATGQEEFRAHGFSATDGLVLVKGEDDMTCAVTGTVEGAPCTFTPQHALTTSTAAFAEFDAAALVNIAPSALELPKRWYLLRPRIAGTASPAAGQWKTIVGFVPYLETNPPGNSDRCEDFPIVPDAFARVAEVLAPSREWCSEQSVSCADAKFDERLPLENELSDDSNGVESSWKHYLTLARTAATQADVLGQQYIDASLAKDVEDQGTSLRQQAQQEKATAELQNLQQICGTAVDPQKLLEKLGVVNGVFDLNAITTVDCSAVVAGSRCIGGRAVQDWRELLAVGDDPELKPLNECIAGFADTTPYVALGDSPLCIWGNRIDLAPVPAIPAPDPADPNKSPPDPCLPNPCLFHFRGAPTATLGICVGSSQLLGLFQTAAVLPPAGAADVADAVRELRHTPVNGDATLQARFKALFDSNAYYTNSLRDVGREIVTQLDYGDFVTVSTSKSSLTTNQLSAGPKTWPCAQTAIDCASGDASDTLFCDHIDCSVPAQRARMNSRLYNAAVAAKLSTWTVADPLPEFDGPYYLTKFMNPRKAPLTGDYTSYENAQIDVIRSDHWRTYHADLSLGSLPTLASSIGAPLGAPWTIAPTSAADPFQVFAFAHWPVRKADMAEHLQDYWGGLSALGGGTEGYFAQRLKGTSHDRAMTWTNEPINIGANDTFADLNPFVDLEERGVDRGADCSGDNCAAGLFDSDANAFELGLSPAVHSIADTIPYKISDGHVQFGQHHGITYTYDGESLMDGLELLGELESTTVSHVDCSTLTAPVLRGASDLTPMSNYLTCLSDDVRRKAALAAFQDFPRSALDPLRRQVGGAYAQTSGDLDEALSELRSALIQVAAAGPQLGGAIRDIGDDMKSFQTTLVQYDTKKKIDNVKFDADIAQQNSNCLTANAAGAADWHSFGLSALPAISTCVGAFAQIGFDDQLRNLGDASNEAQRETAIAEFDKKFGTAIDTLQTQALNLQGSLETVNKQLGIIEGLKEKAARAVDNAIWLLSSQAANQPEINAVLQNRSDGAYARYKQAFTNAKRVSFLAERAIEQRLGLRLADIVETLPLVDAPASWASTVCTTTGIDYKALSQRDGSSAAAGANNFADGFIGDYVTKLENVVESYQLVHNFHEGTDTAVASLRDDIQDVRAECDVTSRNQLYFASSLDKATMGVSQTRVGWSLDGCGLDAGGLPLPNCVSAIPRADGPFFHPQLGNKPVHGFTMRFGDSAGCASSATCGWRADSAEEQAVPLVPGVYRFSWYTLDADGTGGTLAGFARPVDGTVAPKLAHDFIAGSEGDWNRQWFTFNVDTQQSILIGFSRPPGNPFEITVAAPMLEKLDDAFGISSSPEPDQFWDTSDTRTSRLPACQDTDGSTFRASKWTRGCLKLCPDGYSSNCSDRAQTECYMETSFHVSQRDIESGAMFKQSGFAKGNFNYRIESVGLNFVGTGLHDCTASDLPQTCFSAGFVPYTLLHDGPFYVRNHLGQDYLARLFEGSIEHARGLGTERYLTNPLGSADEMLIAPYFRKEFEGRPLDGTFTLRVWDQPGLDFNAIQDVQILLNYRYWTRFN